MTKIDEEAQKHIDDCHVIIDLQREQIDELQEEVKALKGQLNLLRQDRRYEVA